MKVQTSSLDGRINGNENAIKTKYNRFLPEADLQYDIRQGMHLNVDYSTNIQEPLLTTIATCKNNTDPLNIYIGNLISNRNINIRCDPVISGMIGV